jgi:hypothetical protein
VILRLLFGFFDFLTGEARKLNRKIIKRLKPSQLNVTLASISDALDHEDGQSAS